MPSSQITRRLGKLAEIALLLHEGIKLSTPVRFISEHKYLF